MCPLSEVSLWLSQTAQRTGALTFRASPVRDIAPARFHAGSSAFAALLLLIPCPSPSSRPHLLGMPPGLGFLRHPSPSALRLAPAPGVLVERADEVTPFPGAMERLRRAGLSTGFIGSAARSVSKAAGAFACAWWLQRGSLWRGGAFPVAQPHLRLRCP